MTMLYLNQCYNQVCKGVIKGLHCKLKYICSGDIVIKSLMHFII